MRLFSTMYDNRERTQDINHLVGRPISFLKALKLGGKGSSRMLVNNVSPSFEHMMNRITEVNYSSIEIRPYGIIVHLVQGGLKSWAWVIPYHDLRIDTTKGLRITSGDEYVIYRNDRHLHQNKSFINKVLREQQEYLDK